MNKKMTDRRTSLLKTTLRAIKGLYGSHAVAMINLLRKPVTEEYPEYKRPLPQRSRGRIVLTRDPEGDERCVACYLCSAVCPTSCISMESAARQGDGRRYPLWFRINFARCIYCGQCEEACPTLAIQLTPDFEFSKYEVLDFVYEKEDLMVDHGGKHPDYNFYRHAGVAEKGDKGTHVDEEPPINIKTNLP
jgi:NADH-quinone oxidoreductase subunit I